MTDKELFIKLIRISLGTEAADGFCPTPEQWKSLYAMAKRQAVVGALSIGLNKTAEPAPLKIDVHWMVITEKIQEKNALALQRCRQLYDKVVADGFRCCILKGQGNASYYPDHSLRQCGDIDIWIDGGRKRLLRYFRSKYHVGKVFYHHFDAKIFNDVDVEVHTTPSWMNSPRLNRRMQAFIASSAPGQFASYREDLGFSIPAPDFNVPYTIFHIFRHFYAEGIGLRQPMDLYFQLKTLGPGLHGEIMKNLEKLGLGRFTAALMYAMKTIFLLPDECLLCAPDENLGVKLAEEILECGNFGRHGSHYKSMMHKNVFKRAASRTAHVLSRIKYCPDDALAAPFFKFWQRIFITWRYA